MLSALRIEDFAIIDKIELELGSGLVTFTGETGAGKSILIDAVETLLGGRADSSQVRGDAERAIIEGAFRLTGSALEEVRPILERENMLEENNELILGREIRLNGRNVARVNGRSVNASLLREITQHLIDVHGQSEHLSLLQVRHHIRLLDNYANAQVLLTAYQDTYQFLQNIRKELNLLREAERDAARRIDTLTYQINEIEAANLEPGEDSTLREERNRLANAEGLASITQEALTAIDETTPDTLAATDLIGHLVQAMNSLVRLDSSQSNLLEISQTIFDNLTDLAKDLRDYLEQIEFNPKRLDQVEERLALISNFKRKYGNTIEAILAYADTARLQLSTITNASERIIELEQKDQILLQQLAEKGLALAEKRHEEAGRLSRAVEEQLGDLQMANTKFLVAFSDREDPEGVLLPDGRRVAFDSNGIERVEFLIAPNLGEGFKPLTKIASGGETSRLMLALKNVLASADQIPTLIFDEIDQGIGGRVGGVVGSKLWSLAQKHQVLCVTHLPQLAAFGSQHFHVEKKTERGRTITRVSPLHGESRTFELAQMLGGVSEGTLQSAREILQMAAKAIS